MDLFHLNSTKVHCVSCQQRKQSASEVPDHLNSQKKAPNKEIIYKKHEEKGPGVEFRTAENNLYPFASLRVFLSG